MADQLRGIPEVPMFPTRKIVDRNGVTHEVLDASVANQLRRHLTDMRQVVLAMRNQQVVPAPPTNLACTPEAFGNTIVWTRSAGADFHEVLWNTQPTVKGATVVPVGDAQQWFDSVGKNGILRYYWVRARKNTGQRSLEAGPVSGTTLAAGTAVNPPKLPPISKQTVIYGPTGGYDYTDYP